MFTEDVGVGGCRITMDDELPDGTEIAINGNDLLGMTTFTGTGKIARGQKTYVDSHIGWEYGIQFTKVDDHVRRALREMVDSHALD